MDVLKQIRELSIDWEGETGYYNVAYTGAIEDAIADLRRHVEASARAEGVELGKHVTLRARSNGGGVIGIEVGGKKVFDRTIDPGVQEVECVISVIALRSLGLEDGRHAMFVTLSEPMTLEVRMTDPLGAPLEREVTTGAKQSIREEVAVVEVR